MLSWKVLIKPAPAISLFLFACFSMAAWGAGPWNLKALSKPPRTFPAASPQAQGLRAFFYQGPDWKGKPTRVFAWYGEPARPASAKLPAMVLVHGGGGTAFADWVKLWNDRGYAAIAMDTCGSAPSKGFGEPGSSENRPRNEFSGPPCWEDSFSQLDLPPQDQWSYHAIAGIVLANSLLRTFPHVDPKRIGITGISWGGYLTALAAGIDSRFRFAAPVYGCGFLGEDSVWAPDFQRMGAASASRWLGLWDPSQYLKEAAMPMLWVAGTNDFAYPLDSLQKSYLLPHGPRFLSIRIRMPHSQQDGETPQEIQFLADQILKSGVPLPRLRSQGLKGPLAWATYSSKTAIVRAELTFTLDTGPWKERVWRAVPADMRGGKGKVTATVPAGTAVYYFNFVDSRGLVISSPHSVLRHCAPAARPVADGGMLIGL
jgi:dienelactone hydrolase